MLYLDIVLGSVVTVGMVFGVLSIAYNARTTGTSIEESFRLAAVLTYRFPKVLYIYIGGCIFYLLIGILALTFDLKWFGISLLIMAAVSSYSTAYFHCLHRQMARGIRIL